MESTVIIPPTGTQSGTPKQVVPAGPFRAHEIHELYASEDTLQTWGDAVEALWRATMTLGEKTPAWDTLTSRLLIWRAIVGTGDTTLGEWARKQVVRSMGE
jgi:nucleolar pre-ribosomal-associated protein 1